MLPSAAANGNSLRHCLEHKRFGGAAGGVALRIAYWLYHSLRQFQKFPTEVPNEPRR